MTDSRYPLAWNRVRLSWYRRSEHALECILLERVLLEGRLQLRICARLSSILEDQVNDVGAREQFWSAASRKLGKLRRLDHRDRWQIELMIADKIPRVAPATSNGSTKPAANPIVGPHSQNLQRALPRSPPPREAGTADFSDGP